MKALLAGCGLLFLVVGCVHSPQGTAQTTAGHRTYLSSELRDFSVGKSVNLSLADFPSGSNWILLEVVPSRDAYIDAHAQLDVHVQESVLFSPQNGLAYALPCMMVQVGNATMYDWSGQGTQGVSYSGEVATAGLRTYRPTGHDEGRGLSIVKFNVKERQAVLVLWAVNNISHWRSHDGQGTLSVQDLRGADLHWRVVTAGRFDCFMEPMDFRGTYRFIGSDIEASHLTRAFEPTTGGIFGAAIAADRGYVVKILANGTTPLWQRTGTERAAEVGLVPPGAHVGFEIESFSASANWTLMFAYASGLPKEYLEELRPHLVGTAI